MPMDFFIQFGDLGTLNSPYAFTVAVAFPGFGFRRQEQGTVYNPTHDLAVSSDESRENEFSLKLWLFSSSLV